MIGQKGIPATFGGVERHVEELSAHLAVRGHAVTAFVRPSYTAARGEHRGVRLRALPSIATKHLDAITHTALCTLAALNESFDILHYHSVGPAMLSWLPKCLGRRVVATVHALDWQRAKWGPIARHALRFGAEVAARVPDQTIVVSKGLQRCFASKSRRVTWIPNGVADTPRRELARLKRFGLEPGKYVLWMGRFTPEKRCEDLIDAFRSTGLDAALVLAGELSGEDAYVRSLQARAQGDARIVFAGGLYAEDKAEALSNARLMVVPSELEGFAIVLLEGMRAGLCVLASDIEPAREVVTPGETGLLYPFGDVAALRHWLEWIFQNPEKASAIGERGRTGLGQSYDWAHIAAQTETVYMSALGRRGRGGSDHL